MPAYARFAILACLVAGFTGCGAGEPAEHASATPAGSREPIKFSGEYPIKVVCTIGPITEILERLGMEQVSVTGLMGPGVDPHLYRAVPADVEQLSGADLIVYNGLHLEGRMTDVFEKLSDSKPVWAVTEELVENEDPRLRKTPEFDGYYDPHVWHDPMIWADCVRHVAAQLQEYDPEHAEEYQARADEYVQELVALDQYCRSELAKIPEPKRVLVSAHDAFGYFSIRYGLDNEALKGISTDDEVAIGRMDAVVDLLVEKKIPAVFVESAVAPRTVKALVEPCLARGHQVYAVSELYADALGPTGSGADTYVGMLTANVTLIVDGLTNNAEPSE